MIKLNANQLIHNNCVKKKLTETHSHLMQYITPNGGPKSANHVDPSSRNCFPNWHSETINKIV